ncbi:isochorismatase family cysteine hydrolase [Streptomyces sp. NRRL WC-3742]|uniref:isochorismatase family cysteine hydrolase n=1 Tax=Streptomyces sp. NRRL WC-3742 TaxID=1463934 RepID=UPI0004C64B41|nr:isochorismatase family cysteine hydrolase [Streptomyces sp. NRRL WC-3742]
MSVRNDVLVVVDLQNGFIRDSSRPLIPVVAALVDQWQRHGKDVVFTRYVNYPGSPFERLIHWTKCQSSPEIDIVPELAEQARRATAVLDKRIYSLFTEEGTELVRRHGWTDLYICGIATESCVLKTAVDAFERDLTPWLLEDATASQAGQEAHEAGLLVASRFIGRGQIITTADASPG